MGKIIFIVSGKRMEQLCHTLKSRVCNPEEIEVYRATMFDALSLSRTFNPADVDVIITRGETTKLLLGSGLSIPVVDITLRLEEIVDVIKEAKKLTGKSTPIIGFVGFGEIISKIQYFNQITDLKIKLYEGAYDTDMFSLASQAIADGVDAIVSGPAVHEEIKNYADICLILESSYESIFQSYEQAMVVRNAVHSERKRREETNVVLNSVTDAIVAVDDSGHISLTNALADKIFSFTPEPHAEISINSFAPPILWQWIDRVLKTGEPAVGNMLELGGKHYAIAIQPTKVFGKAAGAVITLQEFDELQKMETTVRRKVYLKGNVAKYTFDDIIGSSEEIRNCIKAARSFAPLNSNILIFGETGTGKELFAQSIHNASERWDGPFVAVNCGAIPSSLVESEFFGYVDGAFTGARKNGKIGYFELAHNGTLFLDEVSEMDHMGQIILLRALQEHQIRRVGGDEVIPINTRIIAACNANLHDRMAQGLFRKDLYYRLSVLLLYIPPLSVRPQDIPVLAEHYIHHYSRGFGKKLHISQNALDDLMAYDWEGNVRHLRNFCERLSAVSEDNDTITEKDISALIVNNMFLENQRKKAPPDFYNSEILVIKNQPYTLEQIKNILKKHNGSRTKAAAELGVSRPTLWKYLKKLDFDKEL